MTSPLRLMACLAHPDDEALGLGGVLAGCAAEGIETFVLTATRGQAGRWRGIRPGEPGHPGSDHIAQVREGELRGAIDVLGVRELILLEHMDGQLASLPPAALQVPIVAAVRRLRPQVVITFAPDGGYGHPDHIAISQATTAALVAAADPLFALPGAESTTAWYNFSAPSLSPALSLHSAMRKRTRSGFGYFGSAFSIASKIAAACSHCFASKKRCPAHAYVSSFSGRSG